MGKLEDAFDHLIDKLEPGMEKTEDWLANQIEKGIHWWETREERKKQDLKDNPPPPNPDDY